MIEALFEKLSSFYFRLFGRTKLLPYERLCLDSWRETLSADARQIIEAQLDLVSLVQRQALGAKVCFYYPAKDLPPLLANRQPNQLVATVVLTSPDRSPQHQMPAKLFVHRGRFFSIEFPKRPIRYMEKHGMDHRALEVLNVKVHQVV